MLGLTFSTWIRVGIGVAIAAALIWSHTAAYRAGAQSERREALERSIDLLRERNATDETIRNMDDVALCAALGGRMSDAGTCE
ncbi:hypothetical protein [Chelativorans sp. J32]|uniref:hypothetical protein n=1 Tax=Chelativorans sp. J32 TaxID=935840 RepID=UPI0004BBA29B|nr:hypothetical protein [Chelativorans sp. J32]